MKAKHKCDERRENEREPACVRVSVWLPSLGPCTLVERPHRFPLGAMTPRATFTFLLVALPISLVDEINRLLHILADDRLFNRSDWILDKIS